MFVASAYHVYFAGTLVAQVPESKIAEIVATFECFVDQRSRTIVLAR